MFVRVYMYACMNIKSSYIDSYTYLCCFHTFCIDLHVCLYDIELYKQLCCFHTCCVDLHVCLYEHQQFSHSFIYMFVLLPYLLHGLTCMLVWISIVLTLIYIHIRIDSILVAWICMYVCMNIMFYKVIYIFVSFPYFLHRFTSMCV